MESAVLNKTDKQQFLHNFRWKSQSCFKSCKNLARLSHSCQTEYQTVTWIRRREVILKKKMCAQSSAILQQHFLEKHCAKIYFSKILEVLKKTRKHRWNIRKLQGQIACQGHFVGTGVAVCHLVICHLAV